MPESNQPSQNFLDEIKGKLSNVSIEKRWAMSCYIPIFNIISCVVVAIKMVNSKFCRFHSRQGLVLFALWLVTIFIAMVSPTFSLMLWGITLLLHIAGLVFAYNLKETQIPLIGQISLKIPEFYIFKLLTGKDPEKDTECFGPKLEEVAKKEEIKDEKKEEKVEQKTEEPKQ